MVELSKTLAALVYFRRGPQDMPYSAGGAVLLSLLFAFLYANNHDNVYIAPADNVMFSLVRVYVFGFLVCALLRIKNMQDRWRQTLFAFYGAGVLLELSRWLLAAVLAGGGTVLWIHLTVDFWYLAVCVSIIRHALGLSLGRAVLTAVACNVATSITGLAFIGLPTLDFAPPEN